jgi:hypothetical protein
MIRNGSPRLRLSLRGLLVVVAAAAFGCAALKFANGWWLAAVSAITLAAAVAGTIMVLLDRGRRRAFAIGFMVVLVISQVPSATERMRESSGRLLETLYPAVVVSHYQNSDGQIIDPAVVEKPIGSAIPLMKVDVPDYEWFMSIGQQLTTLLLATLAGLFAQYVYARRQREEVAP